MVVTNPLRRQMIEAYFRFGLSDAETVKALIGRGIELDERDVKETRLDMGLKRKVGLKPMGKIQSITPEETVPSGRTTGSFIKKLKIIDTYAKQIDGGKNMAEVANAHGVTREYVRQVINDATTAGVLDEYGCWKHWDVAKQLGL